MAAPGDKEGRHAWHLPGKKAEERELPIAGIVVHMFCLCKRGNGENAGAKVRCTFQVRCTGHPYACTPTAVCGENSFDGVALVALQGSFQQVGD